MSITARRRPAALAFAFAGILGALLLGGLPGPAGAGEPFQTDARVRAGDVLVQDPSGRWVPARRAGAAPAPGAAVAAPAALVDSSLTAREFAAMHGLAYTDKGTFAVLENGGLSIYLYADSTKGLISTRPMTFKEPVARRGEDLVIPARVVRLLDREAVAEQARHQARQDRLLTRALELRTRNEAPPTPPARIQVEPVTPRPIVKRAPRVETTSRAPARGLAGWVPPASAPRRDWKYIILHHSDDLAGNAEKYDRIHRVDNGWEHGLGYHFVIGNGSLSGDGEVEVGPRWKQQLHGAHAKTPDNRYNDYGVGICLVGNFELPGGRPTAAQMDSLVKLVRWLMDTYDLSPDVVQGHCHCCPTKCPGANFPWDELRRRLR
ncbi:MAG: N-acetylmuramoyl-L-alanine amidase [Planctomycetota bacterium]